MRRLVALLALTTVSLAAVSASAQDFTEGARPAGLGQAYTGVGTGVDGIYHNPAGIARAVMYSLQGTFEYTPNGSVINAGIIDSKTNPELAAGVGYSYFLGRGEPNVNGHDIRLALALPVLPDRISIGIGGRWIIASVDDVQTINQPTVEAGMLFGLTDRLHLGVVGKNLIDVCDNPALCGGVAPTVIASGISFGEPTSYLLSSDLEFDLTSNPEQVQINVDAGAEYMIGQIVPVRVGYQYKSLNEDHLITGGVGWRSNKAGVDASFRLNPADTDQLFVVASFAVYF